jgi:hypothetical protein
MIIIRFSDEQSERRALGWLVGRFSFKTWANGELMLSEEALPHLAREGVRFTVEGRPTYEQLVPAIRDTAPASVQ